MSKAQHTPGNVASVANVGKTLQSYGQNAAIKQEHANVLLAGCFGDIEGGANMAIGNAKRFAAAWNACEGISTEALEAGVVKELRGALEKFELAFGQSVDGGCDIDADDASGWLRIARAAIAKAKGE